MRLIGNLVAMGKEEFERLKKQVYEEGRKDALSEMEKKKKKAESKLEEKTDSEKALTEDLTTQGGKVIYREGVKKTEAKKKGEKHE